MNENLKMLYLKFLRELIRNTLYSLFYFPIIKFITKNRDK